MKDFTIQFKLWDLWFVDTYELLSPILVYTLYEMDNKLVLLKKELL